MNKGQFIEKVAKESGMTQKDVKKVLEAMGSVVCSSLKEGTNIQILGYGSIGSRKVKGRMGKNPNTGETMIIPAHRVVALKAGSKLKAAVK